MVAYLLSGVGRAASRVADYSVGTVIVVGSLLLHELVWGAHSE
jgi:hypothetical protein